LKAQTGQTIGIDFNLKNQTVDHNQIIGTQTSFSEHKFHNWQTPRWMTEQSHANIMHCCRLSEITHDRTKETHCHLDVFQHFLQQKL
jgi:hypothetical protein